MLRDRADRYIADAYEVLVYQPVPTHGYWYQQQDEVKETRYGVDAKRLRIESIENVTCPNASLYFVEKLEKTAPASIHNFNET